MPEIAEAIRRYNDVLAGRSGLAPSTLKSLRVSLIQRFLTHLDEERNLSPNTVRAYAGDLKSFLDFLAEAFLAREPDSVRPEDVDTLSVRHSPSCTLIKGVHPC